MSSKRIQDLARAFAAAAIIVIVVAGGALPVGADNASDLVRYAGRLHILALHVPIGVLVLTLCAEAATLLERYRRTGDLVVGFALPLLVVTGLTAIVLGLALAHGGDYPAKLVTKHRNLTAVGIVVAALALIAWPYRRRVGRWPHRSLLLGSAFFVSVGAHFGGSLTHGADYLFEPLAPLPSKAKPVKDPVDTEAPKETPPPEDAGTAPLAVVDASIVEDAAVVDAAVAPHDAGPPKPTGPKAVAASVFARRCGPCHTSGAKGGLKLSTDPSKMKPVEVVAGNPDESRIIERMALPVDDEYHMPPEKQAQPSAAEVAAVRAWITNLKAAP